jgi:hypothetical protein
MDCYRHEINSEHHLKPVDITTAMIDISGQEGNDGYEYDLLVLAADYIYRLRAEIHDLNRKLGNEG